MVLRREKGEANALGGKTRGRGNHRCAPQRERANCIPFQQKRKGQVRVAEWTQASEEGELPIAVWPQSLGPSHHSTLPACAAEPWEISLDRHSGFLPPWRTEAGRAWPDPG